MTQPAIHESAPWLISRIRQAIGLGIAGNFAGHLEQAGEASDFINIKAASGAPKGVFPFYIPKQPNQSRLSTFPISQDTVILPGNSSKRVDGQFQIEPEIALLCNITYGYTDQATRHVTQITPQFFAAFNDCSHRRPGASKISDKKNWGQASKGFAFDQQIPIDQFNAQGVMNHYRLACYLQRDHQLHAYGQDAQVSGYGYMYEQLLDWLVEKINSQEEAGPLESISNWLKQAEYPTDALIAIGATCYTEFGESHFLEAGDTSIVITYDSRQYSEDQIQDLLSQNQNIDDLKYRQGISMLRQKVELQ